MAPTIQGEPLGPNHKTLHVWSKAIEPQGQGQDQEPQGPGRGQRDDAAGTSRPTFSDAVASIKKEDFANVASTPCARQGFLAGITSGAAIGGLRFVLRGNAVKAANWAVGTFVLGSVASYEYCQYRRRAERLQMKRHIEIVSEGRREQARRAAEEKKKEQQRLEQERSAAQRSWYRP